MPALEGDVSRISAYETPTGESPMTAASPLARSGAFDLRA